MAIRKPRNRRLTKAESRPPVRSKEEFDLRFSQGEFGNRLAEGVEIPAKKLIFQGRVIQDPDGIGLIFSTYSAPIAEALATKSEGVSGEVAQLLLEFYLNAQSLAWLRFLLSQYPRHEIRFCCFSDCLGVLPGLNTIFLEVRRY